MAQAIESASNHLSFYPSPKSLQTLASFEIARLLLRQKLRCEDDTQQNTSFDTWMSGIRQCLRLPKTIGDKIHESVERLNEEISSWMKEYLVHRLILDSYSKQDLQKIFVDLVVIENCRRTIRKFLDSDKFTVVEKYKIACYHCFEDDVKKLWNSVSDIHRLYENEFDYLKKVMYYWTCHMTNVPADEVFKYYLRDFSLEHVFLKKCDLNWPATMYFWSKLNSIERLDTVVRVVRMTDCTGEKLVEFLAQLDEAELVYVLKDGDAAPLIFRNLTHKVEYFDYVLQVWAYFCSFASEKLIWHVLECIHNVLLVIRSERVYQSWMRGQLWLRTSSKVKEYGNRNELVEYNFLSMNPRGLVERLEHWSLSDRYHDISFYLGILKGVDLTRRNKIWRKNWRKLFAKTDRSGVDQLMKLCFENNEDIELFKQTKMVRKPFRYEDLEDYVV